jgi:hypothetical protein
MANKIKITEGQLKKMMANRINEQGIGLSMHMEQLGKLNDMTDSYIRQVKEMVAQGGIGDVQNTYDQLLSQLSNGLSVDGGEESNMGDEYADTKDIPGFEGTMDSLNSLSIREDDEMMNESIKKIKSEFNRFL